MTTAILEKEETEIDFEYLEGMGFGKPKIPEKVPKVEKSLKEKLEEEPKVEEEKTLKERLEEEPKFNYGEIEFHQRLIEKYKKLYEEAKSEPEKEKYGKRYDEFKKDWRKEPIKDVYRTHRKTILTSLRKKGELEKAYKELFGGGLRGLWRKKEKMEMLEALLDSENPDEAMKTYWNYYKIKRSLLPENTKIESYVKQYMKEEKRRENYLNKSPEFSKAIKNVIYMARAA